MDLTERKYPSSVFHLAIVNYELWFYYSLKDWAQREAYLTLRHREAAGLPLIDMNYVDVSSISLPSEEELGDTEIII